MSVRLLARGFGLGSVHKMVATFPIRRGWHQGAGVCHLPDLMMMQAHATLEPRLVHSRPADLLQAPLLETGVWYLMEMVVLIPEQGDLVLMHNWVQAGGGSVLAKCKWVLATETFIFGYFR